MRRIASLSLALGPVLHAQDTARVMQLASVGPRFLSTPAANAPAVDVRTAPALQRRVTLEFDRVPLRAALAEIGKQSGLQIGHSPELVSLDRRVSMSASRITVAAALFELLTGSALDVQLAPDGTTLGLVPRAGVRAPRRWQAAGRIEGRVTDARNGQPAPSATVIVEATSYRATTKNDGRYTVAGVPAGAYNVTARLLGHTPLTKPVTVSADSIAHVDFALSEAAAALERVVTTALGDQRRIELGNSIATINADSLVPTAPITNLTDVLSGRAPGVEVLTQQGQVGAGPRIRIRGLSSLTLSNDPIIYVDGARVDNTAGGANGLSQASGIVFPTPSRLNDIDPADIESIDVLKGPSAATEYGTDAANGVIVVKTKRGHAGTPRWEFRGEQGLSNVPASSRFPLLWDAFGHTTDASRTPVSCPRTFPNGPTVANGGCVIDSMTTYQPLDHSATTIFGTGTASRLGAQVSGGGQQFQYFLGGGYNDATGVLQLPPFEQAQLRTQSQTIPGYELHPNAMSQSDIRGRVTTNVGDRADVSYSAAYISNRQRSAADDWVILGAAVGSGYRDSAYGGYGAFGGLFLPTSAFAILTSEAIKRFSGSASGVWRPATWLNTRATIGIDDGDRIDDSYQHPGPSTIFVGARLPVGSGNGYHGVGRVTTTLYTADLGATATVPLSADMSSKTSTGFQYNVRNQTGTLSRAYGLAANGSLNGAAVYATNELDSAARTMGSYVEENLGWRNRLFVTGALRVDAGSGFGSQVNAAIYPKLSFSWAAVQSAGHRLRLRAAYGESGVQPPNGATLSLYTPTTVLVGGSPVTADTAATAGNTRLKPERSSEFEGGLDAGILNDRMTLELTYYQKLSHNTIVSNTLPGSYGATTQYENLGSVRNYGLEGSLAIQVLQTPAVGWDVAVGGSVNQNRLVSLAPGVPPINAPQYPIYIQYRHVPGYPLFGYWAPRLTYTDVNHDGIIEPGEVSATASAYYVGSSIPTREITLNSGVSLFHERVRVAGQVDYRGGFKIENELKGAAEGGPSAAAFNDPHASLADQARAIELATTFVPLTDAYFEDGSFVRWRELSVTYFLPMRLVRALRMRAGSLTFLSRNLALWTRYTGADPEVTSVGSMTGGAPPDGVYDNGVTPQVRSWAFRINLGL